MKTVGIIQARMSSTRLPGKVLLPLGGECALWWTVKRVGLADGVDLVVVASTDNPADDAIEDYCRDRDWLCFRGSEENVLGRTCDCAALYRADIVVDVTSDSPCVSPDHIELLVRALKENELDYASNVMERTWPDGCDAQVVTSSALYRVDNLPPGNLRREHSSWNIVMNRELFLTYNYPAPDEFNRPNLRLTLDTPQDWRLIDRVLRKVDGPGFQVESLIQMAVEIGRKTP